MALVAASLLFATQCYAAVKFNTSRSNIYHKGGGGGAGATTVKNSKSNSSQRMGGGGGGKGAGQRDSNPPRGGQGMDLPGRR
jgi:hypothetical protein